MTSPSSSKSRVSDAEAHARAIAELRVEQQSAASAALQGVVLHELGVLEEEAGNEGQAAKDLLAAVNALPDFVEPLERLVVLIARRKSHKNLGKLLERLAAVAEEPEEQARALYMRAGFLVDHAADPEGAKRALLEAVEVKPDDAGVWLALEAVAGKLEDRDLRLRALEARAELTAEPTWKALLLLDCARLKQNMGNADEALAFLERAIEQKGAVSFGATRMLEEHALQNGRADLTARALNAQAALIAGAVDDAAAGDALGVPKSLRSPTAAADSWLRAAEASRRAGNLAEANNFLDRARKYAPDEPLLTQARLRSAEAAGDTALAATLAQGQLEAGASGRIAATLWMRVAESAAAEGDAARALEACGRALGEDSESLVATALELDLLAAVGDAPRLAQALATTANRFPTEEGKQRFLMLAADTYARDAGQTDEAKGALDAAAKAGADPLILARAARALAALSGDAAWFDRATRELLTKAPAEEHAELWLWIARSRLLEEDFQGARKALDALGSSADGFALSRMVHAYLLETLGGTANPDPSAIEELAEETADPALCRALRLCAAVRRLRVGDTVEAERLLQKACEQEPGDLVAATFLAAVLRSSEKSGAAASILTACAEHIDNVDLAAALRLEAAILRWHGGDRDGAVDALEHVAETTSGASTILAWALRAARPNDPEIRRRALDTAAATHGDPALALERFALELSAGASDDAARALESMDESSAELAPALLMARALWPGLPLSERTEALERLAATSAAANTLARCALYQLALREEASDLEPQLNVTAWVQADPSLPPVLEWLGASLKANDRPSEVAALRALAARLNEPAAGAVHAAARLVSWLGAGDNSARPLERDDVPAQLANLEVAPPGADPRPRARALLGCIDAIDEGSRPVALVVAGYNLLAAGEVESALSTFRRAAATCPADVVVWEGARIAAETAGDRGAAAEAYSALGDATSSDEQGAAFWEQAAAIFIDELGDPARGELALSRAVNRDITRFSSFDRLFRIVRARRDGPRLLELIASRLEVADDPEEIAKLFWERARALRHAGDSASALEALDNVTMLEPDHVGALALTGEIFITERRFAEAAEKLAHLATLSDAPAKQRLMSGIAAVDLYENKVGDIDRALEVLLSLHRANLSTLPVRERLARAATKAERWEEAASILEELMVQRAEAGGRVEAARLAMAVYRDRLHAPNRAGRAVEQLLSEAPDDGEALDMVLSGIFDSTLTFRWIERGKRATMESLVRAPLDPERAARLAEIARHQDDVQLRQVSLGVLLAVGGGNPDVEAELAALEERVAQTPKMAIDDATIASVRDPGDAGPIPALVQTLATTLPEALGPDLSAFSVTKKDRVKAKAGLPVRNEIAAWAGALGIGEFELYVGGRDPDGVFCVAREVPAVILGKNVTSPLGPMNRQALVRELLALKLGTNILRHRDPSDIAAIVVATCRLADVELDAPAYAMLGEFERQIGKTISRRTRKLLPNLCQAVKDAGQDPIEWVRAAVSTLDRVATIAVGDVSWVLASSTGGHRGQMPSTDEGRARTARLLGFVLSPAFFEVRQKLGMGVR